MFASKVSVGSLVITAALTVVSPGAAAQNDQKLLPEEMVGAPTAQRVQTEQAVQTQQPLHAPVVQVPASTRATAAEIADINEKMSVLQAKLAKLDLEAKIAAKLAEIASQKGAGAHSTDDGFNPSVLEIGGADGKLTASLMMPGSNVQTVRVGDVVGGWTVRSIRVDSLSLSRGKETKRLSFGSGASTPVPATPLATGIMSANPMPGIRLP